MSTYTTETADRVDLGVAWLDGRLGPDWPRQIDLETLDLYDPHQCVIGQLFGSFYNIPFTDANASRLGFDIRSVYATDGYEELQAAWIDKLTQLQSERGL